MGFVVGTESTPADVRAMATAVLRELPAGDVRLVEASANAGSVRYDVLGPDGTLLLVLRVSWHELGDGARRVTLSTHGHRVLERRSVFRWRARAVLPGAVVAGEFARRLLARLS